MDTTKLLVKTRKKDFKKKGYWVTKNPNRNFQIPEFGYLKNFGSKRFTILPIQNFGYANRNLF